jgi:hypothetical protein
MRLADLDANAMNVRPLTAHVVSTYNDRHVLVHTDKIVHDFVNDWVTQLKYVPAHASYQQANGRNFSTLSTLESAHDCEILYCLRRTPVFASVTFQGHRRLPDDHAHHIRRLATIKDCCVVSITIRQTENP